jgi:SAM-dependent methyltransferase
MRDFAINVEHTRLDESNDSMIFPPFKERHRIFPAIFENRDHKNILDTAAGIGYSARRIVEGYSTRLVCNEIAPMCFPMLQKLKVPILSFDLDDKYAAFPFANCSFDAIISLVTIEHLLNVDHFIKEINRILCDNGYLYIATPNYACPEYLINPVLKGRSYHDPLAQDSMYEFYGHLRYFTYITLLEFVASFGFSPDTVYIGKPGGSERYQNMYQKSKLKARIFRSAMTLRHQILGPRFASEPIICFQKTKAKTNRKIRKVIL